MPTIKTAYIQANDIGEQLITPKAVVLHVDENFIKRVQALRSVCNSNNLESVSVARAPDAWLPYGLDSELHMSAPRLIVTPDSFWFDDQPKHARDRVECIPVGIDALLTWFASGGETMIVGDDDEFDEYIKEFVGVSKAVSDAKVQIGRVGRAIESIYGNAEQGLKSGHPVVLLGASVESGLISSS